MKKGSGSIQSGHVFDYRCPECHYLVEKEELFDVGCPICGWISPLEKTCKLKIETKSEQIDLFDDKDIILLTAQLPIVEGDSINIDVEGNTLKISAGDFNRIVHLDCAVEPDIEKTYKNGVLEVKLRKIGM